MSQDPPIRLYKYKDTSGDGIDHVEDMLRNNRIWYSSALEFNDPFDCRCVFDIGNSRQEVVLRKAAFLAKHDGLALRDAINNAEAEIPPEGADLEKWQRDQIEGHSQRAANSGMLCLTPVCDNVIMWTHYARWHTGICIQFRVRDAQSHSHMDFFASAWQIDYADRCPVINVVRDSMPDFVRKAYFTKATAYRYEQEWRIVRLNDGVGLKPLPRGIVGAVILGCQIAPAVRDRIVQMCSEYDGELEIVQAELDPKTYGLDLKLVATV